MNKAELDSRKPRKIFAQHVLSAIKRDFDIGKKRKRNGDKNTSLGDISDATKIFFYLLKDTIFLHFSESHDQPLFIVGKPCTSRGIA